MINYSTTDDKGIPHGTLLSDRIDIQERVSFDETNKQYHLCRWILRDKVWILDHVFTLVNESAQNLKPLII